MKTEERDRLVKHLGKQIVALADVAAELEEVGDLQSAKEEAQKIASEAVEATAQAVATRDGALADLDVATENLKKACAAAVKTEEQAEQKAAKIVDNAQIEAGGMIAAARGKMDAMKRALDQLEEDHRGVVERYAEETEKARARKETLLAELAAVEKRISG